MNQTIILITFFTASIVIGVVYIFHGYWRRLSKSKKHKLYINYHLTRECNYQCGFCFHTAKTSHVLSLEEAQKGLKLLANYGLKKINFAGGEPFMVKRGKYLGELLKYSKEVLNIEICSVVTNGSIIHNNRRWFKKYGQYLDVFAVSCDSFNDDVNKKIGRFNKSKTNQTEIVQNCANLCAEYNIPFKINTVVNTYNWNENMVEQIQILKPFRWKVFQCLLIKGENDGYNDNNSLRNAEQFLIDDRKFKHFINVHQSIKALVPENNDTMRNSYLLLDEYMRFLNNVNGRKEPSQCILDVGVENALNVTFFDQKMFRERDGNYQQTKVSNPKGDIICRNQDLNW